jgi:hypothetical protein
MIGSAAWIVSGVFGVGKLELGREPANDSAKRVTVSRARNAIQNMHQRPGRNSSPANPMATLMPVEPDTLNGCSATELAEPPTSTLAPSPTPIEALPCAPA